jgi:acyl carrier protein
MQNQVERPPITDKEVWGAVCGVLQKRNVLNIPLLAETKINSELCVDSVEVLDIVMELEESFDITIPISALADVNTMGDLANVVAARVKGE